MDILKQFDGKSMALWKLLTGSLSMAISRLSTVSGCSYIISSKKGFA